uniref:N-acetylaspartate synthetase n=1 Tax=Hucho hucho TaxID=62062 RepID=A0A4W5JYK3_9TELE
MSWEMLLLLTTSCETQILINVLPFAKHQGNIGVCDGRNKDNISRPLLTDRVVVRKFESVDYPDVERIFYDGLMEMVPDTAFRGLLNRLFFAMSFAVVCFIATKSFLLTCLVPLAVLCARCYYSRRVVLGYMERTKPTDLGDIEGHYMTTPDSCLWVAVLEGSVVGVVAACGLRGEAGTVEVNRMSVDRRCRDRGVGTAGSALHLSGRFYNFRRTAATSLSSWEPGPTGQAVQQLYQTLGFRCVGVTEGYATPAVSRLVWNRSSTGSVITTTGKR